MARGKKKKTTLRSIYVIEGKDEVSVMKVIEPELCPVFTQVQRYRGLVGRAHACNCP